MAFNRQEMTYGELEESSNRLAQMLKAVGCQRGDRVGLLMSKSIPAIVGMIGILKAECIYVPLDSSSPAPRLARIVQVCEPKYILAEGATRSLLSTLLSDNQIRSSVRIGFLEPRQPVDAGIDIAFFWDDLSSMPALAPAFESKPEDAAHILFTSGSTGVPKGVIITHSNVMHFLKWATRYFGTAASDRISCHPPLNFDLSTFDIYGTFIAGAELHLIAPKISLVPHKLAEFIRESQLTQWFSVPSVLKYMAQFDVVQFNDFPSLKRLLWSGEALPTPTLIYWMKRLPSVTFTNLYGPTETTIASSYYTVPHCPENEASRIPIGKACEGEELIVLDESMQPVGIGEVGDLYIRGVGLSPGYWRNPEKTASAFLIHAEGGRMYKTGDLAKTGEDGLIDLLGRTDSQIKSRGHRIELGEIETALHALGLLRECAVVAVPTDGFEGMIICSAYVPAIGADASTWNLRERLSEVLPPYMVPSRWMAFDALPLNINGKIDRPRLREQFSAAMSAPDRTEALRGHAVFLS
ncbi:MAG: AMP-dependent synthetase and ligase [Bryobacterales bacterium]|nr:AMP-dependent synthetase and ligase [Bryobacterales bacterium]